MQRLPSRWIEHNGITTAYHDEGVGPVLLLLHGFTGSKLDFHDQIGGFSDRYRVVVPDNRGHGESTNTGDASSYTLETLVDDLESFIDTLGLDPIHLLGHSMGGVVVMRYALRRPEKLASLILMDTSSAPLTMPENMREMFRGVIEAEGLPGLLRLMKATPVAEEVRNGIDFLGEEEHWRRVEEKLGQMDPVAYPSLARELGTATDMTADMAAIDCPTTVLVGEADAAYIAPSRAMADAIPGASLRIIPGAAHCPQYENAEIWKAVLDEHLSPLS